ncbi:hypothetical protein HYC85_026853 [Camellia sinensis]|uniref:SHSP domain-containing protein n=1 Tax=Camellia sinensis TaxID=4442 RepID=A0A7J7G8Q1_CAMSI|nr:hypothetical protein HYC85_026853 [Camellia sinensis]
MKLLVEYDSVLIKGEGRKEASKYEDTGRTYNASIEFSSNSFQPKKIKAEFKNGVLRMLIPKPNKL